MSFFGGAETLPKALPFAVGKLSPLGFLRLFRRGRTMATLALMEMVRAAMPCHVLCLAAATTVSCLTAPIAAAQPPRHHKHRTLIAAVCLLGTGGHGGGDGRTADTRRASG